jgi:zinc protease
MDTMAIRAVKWAERRPTVRSIRTVMLSEKLCPPAAHARCRGAAKAALAVLLSLGTSGIAMAQQAPLRATLDNGLRVVIVPDHLAPVVSTEINYLVGSSDAPDGFPGTAHALEHMMFRGTKGLSGDALDAIGARVGGDNNADTTEDVTQYFYTAPIEDLGILLRVEADRMRNLTLSDADWSTERGAIEQEVSRDLSSPIYRYTAQLRGIMFAGTPYAHDALGTRPSFDRTDTKLLHSFYDSWYAPNNAILVIVGDVNPQATLSQVRAAFDGIARRPLPPRPAFSPEPVTAKTLSLDTDLPIGLATMAWRMPGLRAQDFAVADILSDVLGSNRYALYGLVPQGRALTAGFDYIATPQASFGVALAGFPKGADPKPFMESMRVVIADARAHGVPADLVEAAKRREVAQLEFNANSISGQASAWSQALAFSGLSSPQDVIRAYQAVTPAQVNALAARLLTPETAITANLIPSERNAPMGAGGFGGSESFSKPPAAGTKLPDWASAALARLAVPTPPATPAAFTLPNGLRLLVLPEHVSHTIQLFGSIRQNANLEEPKGKEGVASLTDALFEYGSTSRDRLALAKALDDIAADENAGANFALGVLTPDFDKGLAILSDNELHPAFPGQAFAILQRQAAMSRAGVMQSPDYRFRRSELRALNVPSDPALREATPESIAHLTLDDVHAFYTHAFRPDLTTIVVVGDTTPEAAHAAILKAFGGWTANGPKPLVDSPPRPDSRASKADTPDPGRSQDDVTLAETMGLTVSNPDRYALQVGNEVLGEGFTSRLLQDLRVRTGYAYFAGSSAQIGRTRSAFVVNFGADPDKAGAATKAAIRDVSAMRDMMVTDDELVQAKAGLLRRMPLQRASFAGLAGLYLRLADLGEPLDTPAHSAQAIYAVTAADVQTAFRTWVRPADLAELILGPQSH